ncbi:hypothetical protein H6G54_10140 [Anabaena cylindrica FACHB-243]|uniref:PhnA-like protein n=1 Tax=Anabaena cylindrica (strain ATCC 27899 / PCC 7122) TaxID=272123 RepID=K9ZF07_ANACC|nr:MULTISPECIES: hypothetical protein [Anabaena]AFZ57177.1 hypothetical protein Anacy_1677 [Anabaena cylindrica PCC 7122]MBD2418060.1 hypothetical protein [Anabaena cylindrica FACHB-243]MBY5283514.1 hypothetical protein [Anabaena sp. CCAP 1446/1C]MBY5309648.1 hypothetical protein [Anabaena sp. CCAP 1446/1C]MCM2408734.1 hypothetical protein [Anabaena sp. CCAP 1446/1C]
MSYVNRVGDEIIPPESGVAARVTEYRDRVRWGPIISGVLVALATQLILSSLFGALGAGRIADSLAPRTIASGIISNVGIWSTVGLLLSLFSGGWVTTRACGPMHRDTALLNGAILWATTLAVSSFLLASGVWGAFGVAAYNAAEVITQLQQQGTNIPSNIPQLTAEQTREAAAATSRSLWWFVLGSLLGLAAALMGAIAGSRTPRNNNYNH